MRMIWTTQLLFLVAMGVSLFVASGRLKATAAAMVIATAISHVFMLLWVSRDGLLRTAEVLRAYSVHIALRRYRRASTACLPGGSQPLADPRSAVRAAVLIVLALAVWALRDRIPGLRLGLVRLQSLRAAHPPHHRKPEDPK